MPEALSRTSLRITALRVFGASGVLFVALLVVLLLVRPDIVVAGLHAVMNMMP